jgi:hypothetical protein
VDFSPASHPARSLISGQDLANAAVSQRALTRIIDAAIPAFQHSRKPYIVLNREIIFC